MNVLSIEKRLAIVRLRANGATLREVALAVGCDRETVATYGGRNSAWQTALCDALDALGARLGDHLSECDEFLSLVNLLFLTCRFHPEAVGLDDVDHMGCALCRSAGLKRHHKRRKAEGRPIVPPRPKRKAKRPSDAEIDAMGDKIAADFEATSFGKMIAARRAAPT